MVLTRAKMCSQFRWELEPQIETDESQTGNMILAGRQE